MKISAAPIEVLFVLLPDSLALDWAGPAEALRIANQVLLAQGQPVRFVLRFVGPQSVTRCSVGLQLSGIEALPDTLPRSAWVVLIGQPGRRKRSRSASLLLRSIAFTTPKINPRPPPLRPIQFSLYGFLSNRVQNQNPRPKGFN